MIIDSHVHFWDPARGDDILIVRRERPLQYRFYPEDLRPQLDAVGVDRCIVIQSAPHGDETRHLLDLTRDLAWVHGVVGWVDLESEDVADVLAGLRAAGPLVGVRVMLHRLDDASWITRPAVDRGLRALQKAGLSLDLITEP
ncbi:MAG: amidohydrolase, partial [Betaproteobacteria bacterium]|nr:amidohydrolase [Betaproteobacteria bacterium]